MQGRRAAVQGPGIRHGKQGAGPRRACSLITGWRNFKSHPAPLGDTLS